VIDASAVKTSKPQPRAARRARCAPHSVAIAPSLRCLHRLRRPRGCPLSPARPQPAASRLPSLVARCVAGVARRLHEDLRSLSARDSLARRSSAPKGALGGARRHLVRSFISDRRRHSRPFKYRIVAIDLQHSLPSLSHHCACTDRNRGRMCLLDRVSTSRSSGFPTRSPRNSPDCVTSRLHARHLEPGAPSRPSVTRTDQPWAVATCSTIRAEAGPPREVE